MTEYKNLSLLDKYDSTIKDRLRTAGINHISSSIANEFVFYSSASIPVQELITGFNVLQLESLHTDGAKERFAYVILKQIITLLQHKKNSQLNELKLAIVIDESHVLIKNTPDNEMGRFFHKMIDEFRSRGISIIVADQSANNIPEGIVNDPFTKIFMGANDKTGIREFMQKAHMDEVAYENLYNLGVFQGVMICDNNSSGIPFISENLIKELNLDEDCEFQNSYLENSRITVETYRECNGCKYKGFCTIEEKINAQRYAEYFYNLNGNLIKDYYKSQSDETFATLVFALLETAKELSSTMFGCYLKQVFRKYNANFGDNSKDYNGIISLIIKIRDGKCDGCRYKSHCTPNDKNIAENMAKNFYKTNENVLINYFSGATGELKRRYSKELLIKIRENTESVSDIAFCCYLRSVFNNYAISCSRNNFNFDITINNIIKHRRDPIKKND